MGPEKTFICEPTLTRIFWPDLPDEVVEQLVGGKGRESVVHHPSHQVPQLVSEYNIKDLDPGIIKELFKKYFRI